MSNGTADPLPAPRYNIMLTSGILTAGTFGIGLICLTVYAASPSRPLVTAGLTAICAVAATIGANLIVQAVMFRKVAKIEQSVDEHGHNVFVDHSALHRENVVNREAAKETNERVGLITEAMARMLAYEEQRAHQSATTQAEVTELRKELAGMHALMAQICLYLPTDQSTGGKRDASWMADMAESLRIGREIEQRRPPQEL